MSTIKSYTSLEQSRKLAEILPLESADMHWQYIEEDNGQLQWFCFPKDFSINQRNTVSAWSLAALLGVMPRIEHLKPYIDLGAKLDSEEVAIYYHSVDSPYIVRDNLIDACYEMIIKLYKQKIL